MSKIIAHNLDAKERTEDVLIHNENITFQSLLLPNNLIEGLTKCGFKKPSPIQLKALPVGRCGFDLMVRAKSGTGKTLIFALIALETVDASKPETQVLIVAPTREIALQIHELIQAVGCQIKGLVVDMFIGGLKYTEDKKRLQARPCHIAIGTPGRLLHLMTKFLKTDSVKLFVLDEADKLTDAHFINNVNELYNKCPPKKQIITTSATYPNELSTFIEQYMLSPTFITDENYTPLLLGLKQFVKVVKRSNNTIKDSKLKSEALLEVLSHISFTQCLLFSNFKASSESIANFLNQNGWPATNISAAQSQEKRLEVISDLKQLKCKIMTTTDLTARGVDAANVDLVINYGVPMDPVVYLHRMGRAGRYGSPGVCINLALEGPEVRYLQSLLGTIGGTALSIPQLPNFTGNLSELLALDIPPEDYIPSIVPDESEDHPSRTKFKNEVVAMRTKTHKKSRAIAKKRKEEENEKEANHSPETSNEYPETSKSNDFMNIIIEGQNELDAVKEYMTDMKEEDILQSLASGNFNFENLNLNNEKTPNNMSFVKELLSQPLLPGPSTSTPAGSQSSAERNLDPVKVDLKERLLCKNKGLVEVAKILDDPSISQEINIDSVNQYLNLLKSQEQEDISNLANSKDVSDLLEALEHVESSENKEESSIERSTENYKRKANSTGDIDDIENIFKFGYDTIVKESSGLWKNQLMHSKRQQLNQSYEETCDEDDEVLNDDSEDGEPEIMKWVPVKKNKKKLTFSENSNSLIEFNSSAMEGTEGSFSQSGIQEVNNSIDSYEHLSSYFDSCSDNLWENGLSLPNVQSFDDWFFYEWEAQVVAVRNYIQQNIYLQEMNTFKRNRRSRES